MIKYKAYLDDVNTISITAQDRYGNQDTVSVTVYKEITGDEEEERLQEPSPSAWKLPLWDWDT